MFQNLESRWPETVSAKFVWLRFKYNEEIIQSCINKLKPKILKVSDMESVMTLHDCLKTLNITSASDNPIEKLVISRYSPHWQDKMWKLSQKEVSDDLELIEKLPFKEKQIVYMHEKEKIEFV